MVKVPILFLLASSSLLTAENPTQPWSGFPVHDLDRPHPLKVEGATCLTTPPPADAVVLFDGKNTDAFTKDWPIIEGALVASKLGSNRTKNAYGSCQLHLEWRIPAGRKVEGQKGGNSGLFLMGKYEVQIQESHTNVTYADGQAGALYGQYPPLVNPSLPQGEWQSYDITFTAPVYKDGKLYSPASITVIHNGVVIHNNQAFHGHTGPKRLAKYPTAHPKKAPLLLQWHKDPIEFRNFWIRDLSAPAKPAERTEKPQ